MSRHPLIAALKNPAWLCFSWFGVAAGAGMLATFARFQAGSITRPVALDIGREVFGLLNKVELILLIVFLILIRTTGQSRKYLFVGGGLALIVMVQSAWLLPELSARTDMVLAGVTPPKSMAHALYSSLEMLKLGLLLVTGFGALADAAQKPSGAG